LEQPRLEESRDSYSDGSDKEIEVATEESPKRERKIHFETKTMAEVYAKQGHNRIALDIYRRIVQKNPLDAEAQKRISELEAKLSPRKERVAKPGDNST
jgi:hypothetical protein